MRDQWYADNRDLVKWSVLLTLAQQFSVKHILQVLYYRSSSWPQVELDGKFVDIPQSVIRHFRQAAAIAAIDAPAPIEVLTDVFSNREEYHRVVVDRIRARAKVPGIVF